MARATQRSVESYHPAPTPKTAKISMPPSQGLPERMFPTRDELPPPPDDDASGFIDLDKLREAAAAAPPRVQAPPPVSAPAYAAPAPASRLLYQSKTAPPVAATLPAPAPPAPRSSVAMGVLVGSAIAAAGLTGSFFIVSRGITLRDLGIAVAEKREPMALHARVYEPATPQGTSAAPPIAPKLLPAVPAPTAAQAPLPQAMAALGAAPAAVPQSTPQPLTAASEAGAAPKDLGDLDPEHMDSAQKSKLRREKLRAARARRAKSRGDKADTGANDGADDAPPAPNSAFLQTLQKSAEQGSPAPANPAPVAAPEPAPPPRPAPPPAPVAGAPGLAAAMQKAVGPDTAAAPPAAVAAPAPAAPARPVSGVPEAPSLGAVRSALAAQLSQAKSCVHDQDEPSRASLTFGSDGKVQSVTVSGPAAGTPAEECIKGALQRATVAPFSKPTFVVGLTLRP